MAEYQLNLVLHGTWGIEENVNGIRLVTVHDHHHVIVAGDRDNPAHNLSGEYTLLGVTTGLSSGFKSYQNPTANNRTAIRERVEVVINVPYPREIHSVRRFKTKDVKFFETDIPSTPCEMSAAQVLVYDVDNLDGLKLDPCSDWTPEVKEALVESTGETQKVINFHVFASPRTQVGIPEKHFIEVFQSLGTAFGFDITPLEMDRPVAGIVPLQRNMTPTRMADTPLNLEEPITGLDARDTVELHEMRPRLAVSPVNCDMVIFKNRGSNLD